jgi:hypothetical protein
VEVIQKRQCEVPVLVDNMFSTFMYRFDAWPERFFVIKDGKFAFVPKPSLELDAYDLSELRRFLEEARQCIV